MKPILACLLLAAPCFAEEVAFQPLFPQDGPPTGWVTKHFFQNLSRDNGQVAIRNARIRLLDPKTAK